MDSDDTSHRAYQTLTHEHLTRLASIARQDREDLFDRCPHLGVFRNRIITVALCQGGALHYVDGKSGVKDLDVWTIYAAHADVRYQPRRRGKRDFGLSELTGWSGRVDLLGRSLPYNIGEDAIAVWRDYLSRQPTRTAWCLSRKPVALIEPVEFCGQIAWPIS